MNEVTSFNRLGSEESLYLKQHKDNPVHWWPWGEEALLKAKEENKPIFLSVGYSSCHWCHVMAHESFEDQATADILNQNFICIKVDREELPDVDAYYQQACQLFIRTGGWPLSAFLLPDTRPYFVGTYYPKVKRGQGASFTELASELKRAFDEERDKVEENASNVTQAIMEGIPLGDKIEYPNHFPHPMAILDALKEFQDNENGGYGEAPKFPQFAYYEWAVEQMLEGMIDKEHGQHIVDTIERMLLGGMMDHARGGIHRYSVDAKFMVPHFEKMLYDQAGLLKLLAKTTLLYPSPLLFDGLLNTLEYLKLEMQNEEGMFFSAQDADSEGHEGLYFTYTGEEFEGLINRISDENDDLTGKMDQIKSWFNIGDEPNFENDLNVISLNPEKKEEIFSTESWDIIRRVRKGILEDRKLRVPPPTDNKGVASWNFMLLSALIDVMQYCPLDVAKHMASELFNKGIEGLYKTFLVQKEGEGASLRHCSTRAQSLPYFEDYAMFADAQIRLYEITSNPTFKENLSDTLAFIFNQFIRDGKVYTRSLNAEDAALYPNQEVMPFDNSFRSPLSTLIGVVRRARVLFMDPEIGGEIDSIMETAKQYGLKNPLSGGELLRAVSYPDQAYRALKVPAKWLDQSDFVGFISYFLPRFVLDYHNDEKETWEVCNLQQCELKGEGLKEFISSLKPPQAEDGEAN
jgi:uncharacterized protein YyaL (SSP411 family)